MVPTRVGVSQFRAHLGMWLHQVKSGQTLVITERGKPIVQIVPVPVYLAERMRVLITSGLIGQIGERLPAIEPIAVNRGLHQLSDLISDERDDHSLA